MRRLLLFLVFAVIGATTPVENFDEWDFQGRQDTLGIVNGSHSISGAAFTPEPPVVLVKALKTLWTYIPFPEIPQLDPEPLNQILDQALFELNDLDLRMSQYECADAHLFSYWKQLLRDNLAEVFQSHQIFKTDLEIMRQSLTVFLNSSMQDRAFERPNRYKRSLLVPIVGTALGSELSRIFLRPLTAPIADKFSCFVDKLVPFGSLCKEDERKKIEALARQVKDLEENVVYLKSKLLEAITVRIPADVERRKLPTLKKSLQENVEMLNETIRGVLEEIKDYVEKAECVARHVQDRHRNTLIIAASLQNLTIQYRRLVNDVNQQRISLANMASLMQDAMASLVHGYLPIALIPPTILSKTLDTFEVYGLNEAIPRKLIAAYYTFEVVRDAYISDEGLHLLIEIPLYTGHGVHDVFRATPIPQPIPQTERATQYQLTKTHLLMSWDKTNFAEVTEQELSTHCWGSHRLRLCKQPFSTTKSQKTTCLTGLYFNLPATVLKLCAQEVVALPQHPQALYLFDSTYLLTSAKGDFTIQNLIEHGEIRVPGCQSCLVKPSCKGRLQLPNAGLFLTPDPLTCIQESSDIVRILPTPLLRPLFEGLKELEEVIPPELMGDVHQNLLSHLKLNLAGLPDRRITEETLAAVVQPFMQEVEEVHTTIVKKIWRDVILPCEATLITLGLLLLLGWALKMGKLYAMRKYVARFRCNDEETAAAAALQLSNIDVVQEESVLEKESTKKSAPPKISQGETSSKKPSIKN